MKTNNVVINNGLEVNIIIYENESEAICFLESVNEFLIIPCITLSIIIAIIPINGAINLDLIGC